MILLPIIFTAIVFSLTFSEPAPVNKTTKEVYQERLGNQKRSSPTLAEEFLKLVNVQNVKFGME